MEIEIITTKKKLTASIVRQLQRINHEEIINAVCLGYVVNIIKHTHKAYIIKLENGEYRMLESNWYSYDKSTKIFQKRGLGTAQIELNSNDNVTKLLTFMETCKSSTQIFI